MHVVNHCRLLFLAGMTFGQAVQRFNSNIPYSGLLHAVTAEVSSGMVEPRFEIHWMWTFSKLSERMVTVLLISLSFVQTLFAENKEKLINGALAALLEREGDQSSLTSEDLEAQFHALRRLVASKAGFGAFTRLPKYDHFCFNYLF